VLCEVFGVEAEVAQDGGELLRAVHCDDSLRARLADFDDLVRLARESGARRIITMHGAKKFAGILRDLGLNAEHLAQHPSQQKSAKGSTKKAANEVEQRLFE